MSVANITGTAGLIGAGTAGRFGARGFKVIGINNDIRAWFFGPKASSTAAQERLHHELHCYQHLDADIRDLGDMGRLFEAHGRAIRLSIHMEAAADPQPRARGCCRSGVA
jgi:CDP-paratose 2-epimerase